MHMRIPFVGGLSNFENREHWTVAIGTQFSQNSDSLFFDSPNILFCPVYPDVLSQLSPLRDHSLQQGKI